MLTKMLEPQPQGWEFSVPVQAAVRSLVVPVCTDHGAKTGKGHPGDKPAPQSCQSAASAGSCYPLLSPGQSRAHRDCICSSHQREGREPSVLSARRAAGMKFPKSSLGAENKLFPRFRVGPCQWNRAKATVVFGVIVRELS